MATIFFAIVLEHIFAWLQIHHPPLTFTDF